MAALDVDSNNTDIQILLIVLSCCGELNLDSKVLAEAFGITRGDNALRKVKQILTKHDYKYKGGKITRNEGAHGTGQMKTVETPKKTPKKRSCNAAGTPASKKRKLNVGSIVEDGENEGTEAGENENVKTEVEEEVV